MAVTTEVALGSAANVTSCALSLIRTRLPAQRSQKLHLFRFPTPTSESSGVFSLFCGLLRTFCTRDPLFSTLSELFCQKQGVGGMSVQKIHASRTPKRPKSVTQWCRATAFTDAPRRSEILHAGAPASERRPCGHAKGWSSTPRYWPRPHGANSLRQTLSRPLQSQHCF